MKEKFPFSEKKKLEKVTMTVMVARSRLKACNVSNLTYTKKYHEDEFILQNINYVALSKSLTVITGLVGSGKSTPLSAFLVKFPTPVGRFRIEAMSFTYLRLLGCSREQ